MKPIKPIELLQTADEILTLAKDFADKALLRPIPLDSLIESLSDSIDKLIAQQEKKESIKFVSGVFKLKSIDQDYFSAVADLYFMDKDRNWLKKTVTGRFEKKYIIPDDICKIDSEDSMKIEHK